MSFKQDNILNAVQGELNPSSEVHVGGSSHFKLPEGWTVEEKPRPSRPTHVDKYYYEPHTGRKFRSLASVQKYLAQEAGEPDITEKKESKDGNKNSNSFQFGEGKQLEEEPPKFALGPAVKISRGVRSSRNRGHRFSSQSQAIIPNSFNHYNQHDANKPVMVDNEKKTNAESSKRVPLHNLTGPIPEKVSWVLSGADGFWNPFIDGVAVPEAERLRWSEAFVQTLRGDRN